MREQERTRIIELFDAGHRLVTITGLGGIGKSTLALEVIDEFRRELPELGCSVLDIGPTGGTDIRERLLDDLGITVDFLGLEGSPAVEAAEPRLVVIDGGEHLLDHAGELQEFIDAAPALRLLVTSRVSLDLPAETTVSLRGLGTAAGGDAVRLFLALAEEHSVELAPDDRPRVREIVTRLGGYPLAIRLCVIQLQTLSLGAVHEQIIGRRRQPEDTTGTDPILREVIEWSLDRQTAQAVRLLKLLAVFNGWSTLDSIEGVAAEVDHASGLRRGAGRTLWLAELVDAGLVDVEEAPALGETIRLYRVHDGIREVSRGYRVAVDEASPSTLSTAHRRWYAGKAGELAAAATTRRESSAFEQLHAEFAEYSLALDDMIDTDPTTVIRIVNQTGDFWLTRGHLRIGARLLRRALRRLGEEEDGLGTGALNAVLAQSWINYMKLRSGTRIDVGAYQHWLSERLQEALDASAEPTREHFALAGHFIFVAMMNNEYDDALELGARCRDLAIEAGDDYHAGMFCFWLARVSEQAGDGVAAAAHIEQAAVHVRRTQNESFLARCVSQAVLIEQDRLSPTELVERLKPLPEIHLKHRSFRDAALISIPLAIAYVHAGENAESLALLRRTLALSHRVHYFDGQLYAVVLIAFSELSPESTPEDIARCARLYGSIRPHLKRFYAITAPNYQRLLEGGIQGLRLMLGQAALDRIADQSPTFWPDVMAEADAFAAEQLQAMAGTATEEDSEPDAETQIAAGTTRLNDRERELLELVLTGITDKQIADRLELKPNTVRSYNSRVFRKFDVASRTELLALFRGRDL